MSSACESNFTEILLSPIEKTIVGVHFSGENLSAQASRPSSEFGWSWAYIESFPSVIVKRLDIWSVELVWNLTSKVKELLLSKLSFTVTGAILFSDFLASINLGTRDFVLVETAFSTFSLTLFKWSSKSSSSVISFPSGARSSSLIFSLMDKTFSTWSASFLTTSSPQSHLSSVVQTLSKFSTYLSKSGIPQSSPIFKLSVATFINTSTAGTSASVSLLSNSLMLTPFGLSATFTASTSWIIFDISAFSLTTCR